jgi:hypothetical protein
MKTFLKVPATALLALSMGISIVPPATAATTKPVATPKAAATPTPAPVATPTEPAPKCENSVFPGSVVQNTRTICSNLFKPMYFGAERKVGGKLSITIPSEVGVSSYMAIEGQLILRSDAQTVYKQNPPYSSKINVVNSSLGNLAWYFKYNDYKLLDASNAVINTAEFSGIGDLNQALIVLALDQSGNVIKWHLRTVTDTDNSESGKALKRDCRMAAFALPVLETTVQLSISTLDLTQQVRPFLPQGLAKLSDIGLTAQSFVANMNRVPVQGKIMTVGELTVSLTQDYTVEKVISLKDKFPKGTVMTIAGKTVTNGADFARVTGKTLKAMDKLSTYVDRVTFIINISNELSQAKANLMNVVNSAAKIPGSVAAGTELCNALG